MLRAWTSAKGRIGMEAIWQGKVTIGVFSETLLVNLGVLQPLDSKE